jgi:hypothetical protein
VNNLKREHAFALLGALLLLTLGIVHLADSPGFHFDEAWAMNYAYRIAFEPGFWPLTAMSPYTAPWAHYWAALFLRTLGPSLLVFRASQFLLSSIGLFLLGGAFERRERAILPWAILFLPGLWLNHRFGIELTGFHVFCFGVLLFAIARGRWPLACLAALLGTTAHILFYSVGIGGLAALLLSGRALGRKPRMAFVLFFAGAALFFLRVLLMIPEKGKGAALLVSALLGVALLLARAESWALWRWAGWRWLLGLTALAFLANTIFFAEGLWTAALYSGWEAWKDPVFELLLAAALASLASLAWKGLRDPGQTFFALWFQAALAFAGLMMLKPAPRYFELPMLCLALFCAQAWRALPREGRLVHGVVLGGNFLFLLGIQFFSPIGRALPVERPLHFLVFRDSSRDYLSTQALAAKIGGMGCKISDIGIGDSRVRESLQALSHSDWPLAALACPGKFGLVRREYLQEIHAAPQAGDLEYADFVLQRR